MRDPTRKSFTLFGSHSGAITSTTIMLSTLLKFLHLQIWRRLPHKARRAALFRVAALSAPRIAPDADAKGPVIIVGMLRQASGLGAAARACHDALKAAGIPVYGIDLTTQLMHEANHFGFAFKDGRGLLGEGTILLHISGPLVPLAMMYLGRSFVRKKRIIAHWFWELPRLPKDWLPALAFVHEICVNTHFVADAVRAVARNKPVHVVSYPLSLTETQNSVQRSDSPFTVLVIFNIASNFTRKNPCAAIAAFRRAFGDDPSAHLIVKFMNGFSWPEGVRLMKAAAGEAPNITLLGDVLDEAGIAALYKRAHVVMSLHRAEGLGLTIAEAMLQGLPVIATNWSGNTDFLTSETGIPVGYTLEPVNDPQGNYPDAGMLWAEADIDRAALALQALDADPTWRQSLGRKAAAFAREYFRPSRYAEQIRLIISGLDDTIELIQPRTDLDSQMT